MFGGQELMIKLKNFVMTCRSCSSRIPLHQWDLTAETWQRLHIDFAVPYRDKMWLLIIDAYSKWPEIHSMDSKIATRGLPCQIITDNV